jgi:hypothetical protein
MPLTRRKFVHASIAAAAAFSMPGSGRLSARKRTGGLTLRRMRAILGQQLETRKFSRSFKPASPNSLHSTAIS